MAASPTCVPMRGLRPHLAAVAFFALLTAAVTWPLLLHLGNRVPGWYVADNYEYLWKIWWFKTSLIDAHVNPLVAPRIFYPEGFNLAFAELTPLHTVVALPLTLLFGEVTTYNLAALLSFIVTGWATFTLVRLITKNTWSGLLAGVLYSLSAYHVVRYGGILPLMAVEGIPIVFLGIEGWWASGRLRWVLVASVGVLVAGWASVYYAAGLAILVPVYLVRRLWGARNITRDRRTWPALLLFTILAALLYVPLSLPYLTLGKQASLKIPLADVDFWSASILDYILPTGLHPIWGAWVRENLLTVPREYPQIGLEFVLGTGFVTWLFVLYSRHGLHNPSANTPRYQPQRAMTVLVAAALLLSFGPRLHIGRYPLVLPAPSALVDVFQSAVNTLAQHLPAQETYQALAEKGLTVPLPALLLRWLIPPFQGLRAWNRFAAFAVLGLAVLAGIGYANWDHEERSGRESRRGRRPAPPLRGAVVLCIAVFELWPQRIPLQDVSPRPVDEWLAAQTGDFTIMELPLTSALSAPQMLYTRYHGKRIAFAYGTFFPYWYRDQFPQLARCPDAECLALLRTWDVRYILVNLSDTPSGPLLDGQLEQSHSLRKVARVGDHVVYEILPGP